MGYPIGPGDTVALAEIDYRYGIGGLRLRVIEILATEAFVDGPHIHVRGIEVRSDGSDGAPREAYLRLTALAKADTVPQLRKESTR